MEQIVSILRDKIIDYMNKYEIIDTIGEGEYGVVLKAKNKQTNQLVAIKKFKEDDSHDENKRVILREVKILKMLSHQNVIQLKQAFRKKGKIYLVCEYVEKNLLEILEETPLTPNKVKHYTHQLLKGIQFMHSLNIIHRDIKPQNLLIGKNDILKICDLGFARAIPTSGGMTDYVATRWYRPPELLVGRDDYDKSIDIWAIGCVMAEMIDGQPLFGGQNDLDQLYLIQKCLGPLTSSQQEYFLKNTKFNGMRFPEINITQSLERRYFGKIDKFGLDLLKKMIVIDPKARITVQKALLHPYFNRNISTSESELKKINFQGLKNDIDDGIKAHVPFNNFIHDQKGLKTIKDEKVRVNKVTGLTKISKIQINNSSQETQSPWLFNKNKSLTKKGLNVKPKQKSIISHERYSKGAVIKNKMHEQDQYEGDEDWVEEKQQVKREEREERSKNQRKQQVQKHSQQKSKKIKWSLKRDNIMYTNSHPYNFNVVDDLTAR